MGLTHHIRNPAGCEIVCVMLPMYRPEPCIGRDTNRTKTFSIPGYIRLSNYPWKIEYFLEDLFLGGQLSIILGYRRLSVKSLLVCGQAQLESF